MIRKQSSEVLAAQSCNLRRLLSPPSFLGRQREDRLMQWIFGLAPKKKILRTKKWKKRIYVQRITPTKKKYFVSVRPVVTYEIADGINLATLFPQDLLQEKDNVQLSVVNYILYGNGKSFIGISQTSIQLVRTCLVLNWDQEQKGSLEEVHTSFVEVRTNDLIRDFIRIELVKSVISYTGKRKDRADFGLIPANGLDCTNINPFYSKSKIQPLTQLQSRNYWYVVESIRNANLCLSSSNCSQIGPFNGSKYNNESDPIIPIRDLLGPIVPKITNFYSSYHLITHNKILLKKYLLLDNLKLTFQVLQLNTI